MSKKLLVINPEQCVEVQFDQQITIGRDVFNSLCLKDPELSRSHAIIFEQDGETVIKDLRSRNGVYVKGERITESGLHPDDEIILGSSVMIFEPSDTLDLDQALSRRGKYLIEKRAGRPMMKTPQEPENIYSTEEMDKAVAALFAKPDGSTYFSTAHAMALLQAIKEMDEAADPAQLFEVALRRALASLGGHRGVLMEADETKEHLKVRAIVSAENTNTILIGQPVLKTLLGTEKCVFCPDVHKNPRYETMAAKSQRPIHGFLATPVLSGKTLFGFIYLETEDASVSYDFAALRTLYFIAFHLGALLRQRARHAQKSVATSGLYRSNV